MKEVCPTLRRYRGVDDSLLVGSPCVDQKRSPLSRTFVGTKRGLQIARPVSLVADTYQKYDGHESASQHSELVNW